MIRGAVVIDASVTVELLVRIEHWSSASALFRDAVAGSCELWAPDLVYAECLSAFRNLVRRKAITPREGARVVGRLPRLPLVTTGTGSLVPEIWALRDVMTPYDAAYAALARRLDAPLVTADARLARAYARKGGRAMLLGDLA